MIVALRNFLVRSIALALVAFTACAATENLVSLRTGALPPVPETISRLLTLDGQPAALGAGTLWTLAPKATEWTRRTWRVTGEVLAAASRGSDTYLLLGASGGPVERIEKLSLDAGEARGVALPALPQPLEAAHGAVLGDILFVAGVAPDGRAQLLSIDAKASTPAWTVHPAWPGAAGEVTSLVGQTAALFATVRTAPGEGERLLRWVRDGGWSDRGPVSGTVIEGGARPVGQAHILYLVRDPAPGEVARLRTHHTITGSWATLGDPKAADARMATASGNGLAWIGAGLGPPGSAEIESHKLLLGWLDWIVVVTYLVSMLGMGLYFYLREKRHSTADFFVGGRTIPFWAAGVSLYAANTSSISYIAIPAKAFETNWQYLTNNLVAVTGLMFVAVWIVPLLRRLDLMSVFAYLETRFHPMIRTLASALFMAVQIGSRMSVILFLPSLAIATILGIDVAWSILIMGVFTMIYTAMGGMKAVVWTDFVQLIVKMGGIVFAIGFVVHMLDGGWGELLTLARAEDKMKLFDFSFDLTKATVWGFIFLVLFDVVLTFPKDQVLMQRVLSTRNSRDAGRSIWTLAAIMIPGGFMFYFVGTALFAFYKTHPERMNPLLTIDATFPLFIAAELPMGIRGLIIAGILAAAMATLSSIMNSVATLASVDFYEKWVKHPNPKVSVRFAEAMTIVTGLLGMGVALLLSRYDIHSLFDISIELAGLLGGGFAGAYTLGMFTRRANWQGVAIGVAVSIALTVTAWTFSLVHPYFYLAISILLCIVVGYAASYLFPPPRQSLAGLTIYDTR